MKITRQRASGGVQVALSLSTSTSETRCLSSVHAHATMYGEWPFRLSPSSSRLKKVSCSKRANHFYRKAPEVTMHVFPSTVSHASIQRAARNRRHKLH
ncbi:unnamed protein product [Chondrus crispus]|uniref:Uncharacterized protein n=1 Tax=Chondrus crispus TaxID=2769 RepID=R7QRA4_CHOCR|nr:unnamed protein product [Chondrus crispus]CDF40679.1 unnamed protein product [Chondrus crispus]|eukprot:XP_005710973.1 unnamed protein product [Chondrus crispus]